MNSNTDRFLVGSVSVCDRQVSHGPAWWHQIYVNLQYYSDIFFVSHCGFIITMGLHFCNHRVSYIYPRSSHSNE